MGLILRSAGKIKPIPPRISLIPMKRTMPSEKLFTNVSPLAAKSATGMVVFIKPAMMNAVANNPCATHSAMCSAFDCFISFIVLISQQKSWIATRMALIYIKKLPQDCEPRIRNLLAFDNASGVTPKYEAIIFCGTRCTTSG